MQRQFGAVVSFITSSIILRLEATTPISITTLALDITADGAMTMIGGRSGVYNEVRLLPHMRRRTGDIRYVFLHETILTLERPRFKRCA